MNVLVYSTFARSMFGVIKAFVSSYTWFVIVSKNQMRRDLNDFNRK